jgi:hypothetical protein
MRAVADDNLGYVLSSAAAAGPERSFLGFVVASCFAASMAFSVYLVKYAIMGVPVRALFAFAIAGLVGLARPVLVLQIWREFRFVFLLIFAMALIGYFASAVSGTGHGQIARKLIEIHFQAFVGVLVGAMTYHLCGARKMIWIFGIVVGLSTAVALLQFLDVAAAWEWRSTLGAMQPLEIIDDGSTDPFLDRAMGLSFSPIHIATQLSLLFACMIVFMMSDKGEDAVFGRVNMQVLVITAVFILTSVISGNRSPLLGYVLFLAVYVWKSNAKMAIIFAMAGIVTIPILEQLPTILQELGLRVGNTEDGSAQGRLVLQYYGLLLFLGHPYGYGLGFESTRHWPQYWDYVKNFENADAVTMHALHNYYLLVLNKYGFLVLGVAAVVLWKLLGHRSKLVAFIPYMVHIFYHNDGPFQSDFIFWYLLPIVALLPTSPVAVPVAALPATARY